MDEGVVPERFRHHRPNILLARLHRKRERDEKAAWGGMERGPLTRDVGSKGNKQALERSSLWLLASCLHL